MTAEAASYWQKFLQKRGYNSDKCCAGEMCFEAEGFFGDELLALVLAGKKTAFFSSYASYIIDNEELPAAGERYVVLDRSGSPRCIIEKGYLEDEGEIAGFSFADDIKLVFHEFRIVN